MRIAGVIAGTVILAAVVSGGSAFASATANLPAGGAVYVHATGNNGPAGTIVFTGAIGDYGKTLSVDKNGKTDNNGNFVKITLHQGTFEVNSTALNAKTNHAQPVFNKTTCSFHLSGTGPVNFFNGTGLYKGNQGESRSSRFSLRRLSVRATRAGRTRASATSTRTRRRSFSTHRSQDRAPSRSADRSSWPVRV